MSPLALFKQTVFEQTGARVAGRGTYGGIALAKGIGIQHLEQVKALRQALAPNVQMRYWFRGPRLGMASTTLKQNAHSFDIYLR